MAKIKLYFIIILFVSNLGVFISVNVSAQKNDTLSFLHVTDTHLIFNPKILQPDLAKCRNHYAKGVDLFKKFLKKNPCKTSSDFVVATGDLIDFYEGEIADGEMMDSYAKQFTYLLDKCKVPVFLTLGNHDISSNSWGTKSKVSSQDCVGRARAAWIKHAKCFKEGTYYSRVFDVGETSYRLIFLDNSFDSFHNDENIKLPYVDKPQLHWLEGQLKKSADDVEIIMMHIPIILEPDQPKPLCELYSVLEKSQSTKLVIAGHDHENINQDFFINDNVKFTQIQSAAFGRSINNWRVIRLTENKILISLPGSTEIEMEVFIK